MEGNATYRFATKTMATTALESIRRSGLQPDDIDLFIPHQANIRIIEAVAKGLNLPMDKMFINLDKYGNTSAASVPIALAEAVNEGRVKVGDNVTIVAFGAGFTSGAVTINWTADPARGIAGDAAVKPEDVSVRTLPPSSPTRSTATSSTIRPPRSSAPPRSRPSAPSSPTACRRRWRWAVAHRSVPVPGQRLGPVGP